MPTLRLHRAGIRSLLPRRTFLFGAAFLPTALLAAEPTESTVTRLAILASALTGGDEVRALNCFSTSAADFATIQSYLEALTAQSEVSCAIETIAESGDDPLRTLETDWLLQLTARTADSARERRRQKVTIQMRLEQKRAKAQWKITAFTPLSILFPINIR